MEISCFWGLCSKCSRIKITEILDTPLKITEISLKSRKLVEFRLKKAKIRLFYPFLRLFGVIFRQIRLDSSKYGPIQANSRPFQADAAHVCGANGSLVRSTTNILEKWPRNEVLGHFILFILFWGQDN